MLSVSTILDDQVVATVSDHLDWSNEAAHLLVLQEKLNSYLAFVESGELPDRYPSGKGRRVRIDVVLRHDPPDGARQFFRRANAMAEATGVALQYRVLAVVQ